MSEDFERFKNRECKAKDIFQFKKLQNHNYQEVIDFTVGVFNLTTYNGIKKITVIEDNSNHYLCYLG